MASHARLVLTDLLTALRADLGDLDLSTVSGTPKVVIADGPTPPAGPPWLALAAPVVEVSYNGAPLTEYHVVGDIDWYLTVAFTADTTESRAFAALDAADEVITAIQNAHHNVALTTLYALTVLTVTVTDVFGEGPGIPDGGGAVVQGRIRYETDISRGT